MPGPDTSWPPLRPRKKEIRAMRRALWQRTQEYLQARGAHADAFRALFAQSGAEDLQARLAVWYNGTPRTPPEHVIDTGNFSAFEVEELRRDLDGIVAEVDLSLRVTMQTVRSDVAKLQFSQSLTVDRGAAAEIVNGLPEKHRAIFARDAMVAVFRCDCCLEQLYLEDTGIRLEGDDEGMEPEEEGEGSIATLDAGEEDGHEEVEPRARYEYAILRQVYRDLLAGTLLSTGKPR